MEEVAASWQEKKRSPENIDPREKLPPANGSGRPFTDTGLSMENKAGPDAAAPTSSKTHGLWLYQ